MEGIRPNAEDKDKKFVAQVTENAKGEQWYLDKDRRLIKLDKAAELERERQQNNLGTLPADGYPEFGTMLAHGEMPVAPGEIAPASEPPPGPPPGPKPPEPPPEPGKKRDPRNFSLVTSAERARGGAAGALPNYYWYLNPDGTWEADENGHPKLFDEKYVQGLSQPVQDPPEPPPEPPQPPPAPSEEPPRPEPADPTLAARMEGETGEKLTPTHVARLDIENLPELPQGMKAKTEREIHADPKLEILFSEMLKELAPVQAAKITGRAIEKKLLDASDLRFLAAARHEFTYRLYIGEILQTNINDADIKTVMRRREAFRDEVELNDVPITMKVMKEQAMVLAMKRPRADLERWAEAQYGLYKYRETATYKAWETAIKTTVGKSGRPWGYYKESVMGYATKAERMETRRILAGKIADGRTAAVNALSWAAPFLGQTPFAKADRIVRKDVHEKRREIRMAKHETKLAQLMEEPGIIKKVNDRLGILTDFYQLTLSHDPEVRLALQQGAFRNEEVSVSGEKPATFKEAQAERARLEGGARAETAVKREWDEHRRSIPGWNSLSDEKRQQELDSWAPRGFTPETSRNPDGTERRRGFFALVLEMLANALLSGFKKNLSAEKI